MPEFKLTINDVKTGKSYKKVVSGAEADAFKRKKISDKVEGEGIGLKGYELQITGGSDNAGFPMRFDIGGIGRKRPFVTGGVGAKVKRKGVRARKTVAGNQLSHTITQINLKVTKYFFDELVKLLGKEQPSSDKNVDEEKKTEAKPEEKKEAPKEEVKPEVKKEE